jgi:DNA mismatch repair protein MutH
MSVSVATGLRNKHLPADVLSGDRSPTLGERSALLDECVLYRLPVISMGKSIGKIPSSAKDKNWRGRALEAFLGGKSTSKAARDFTDGELKSTRVVKSESGWGIEQTLRITTLNHASGEHLLPYHETPLYKKVSKFSCAMWDSQKSDIESGTFVGAFVFDINDDPSFHKEIREDYEFYLKKIKNSERISSTVRSPNGFLRVRQTAGKAGAKSKTSLYIADEKFNWLLSFYGVNKKTP